MRPGRAGPVRTGSVAAVLVLAACQSAPEAAAPAGDGDDDAGVGRGGRAVVEVAASPGPAPGGGIARVGVPAEPAGGLPVADLDVAGADLLALWGLPLYRVDAEGLLVPALVETADVSSDGTRVRLSLRAGVWSDGREVTADDLAATVDAVRAHPRPADDLAWLEDVEVVDEVTVVLHLRGPTRRWPLLLEATGVLPAHVLEETGLEELGNPPAVVGGHFRPVDEQPGLRRRLEAHPEGPLGAPGPAGIEVVVVPSFDAALGLLGEGALDAVIGHLAVRAGLRVAELEREAGFEVTSDVLEVAAPVGGTQIALRVTGDGDLGEDAGRRRALHRVVDVEQLVEGLGLGRLGGGPLPGRGRDRAPDDVTADADDDEGEAPLEGLDGALTVSNEQEALVATGRLLEAQVRGAQGRLRVEGAPTPEDVRRADDLDAALVVRRPTPTSWLRDYLEGAAPGLVEAAEASPSVHDPEGLAAWGRARELAVQLPLYEAPVAHVWHERLEGMEPSAQRGAGLAGAWRWRLATDG